MLVDSGASGHYLDDIIILGLRDKLNSYQVLDVPRNIITVGGGQMDGVTQEVLRGMVVDGKGARRSVQLSCLVVPGLVWNLFPLKQAARNGIVSIFDTGNARLEANNFTLPLQELSTTSTFSRCILSTRATLRSEQCRLRLKQNVAPMTGAPQPQKPGRRKKARQQWGELRMHYARL